MASSLLPHPSIEPNATGNDNENETVLPLSDDSLFYICWGRQACGACLKGDAPCSWCAVTSTCVPNRSRVPILAPLDSSSICPLGSEERWELRALPFGCHVSTITFLTACVAVLGTLALVGLVALLGRLWECGKGARGCGWGRFTGCVQQRLRRWWIRLGRSGIGDAEEDDYERHRAEAEPLLR
ncbi:hypothetical protein IFM47457_06511 [Aspergillus lentulus]|nr:hypothetical protein IFM47457_06511 [Aspergillus lentulus]